MTPEEQAQWIRTKRIAEQKPIEIEERKPLPGQRDLLETGPQERFELTGKPKSKRRK